MSYRQRPVETVSDAVTAYGGMRKMCRAFGFKVVRGHTPIHDWMADGVPRGWQLALYLGLRQRGRIVSPRLMGVDEWHDMPGVALN